MGNVHRAADRRLAAITIGGLALGAATTAAEAFGGHPASASAATTAELAFVAIYRASASP